MSTAYEVRNAMDSDTVLGTLAVDADNIVTGCTSPFGTEPPLKGVGGLHIGEVMGRYRNHVFIEVPDEGTQGGTEEGAAEGAASARTRPRRTPNSPGGQGHGRRRLTLHLDDITDEDYADVANAIWAVVVATGHTGTMTPDRRVSTDTLNRWWADQATTTWE